MFLSLTMEYAFRIAAVMSHHGLDKLPIRSEEIAKKTHIPNAYLSKILRKLVSAGILLSLKGHGGGFTLSRSSRDISLQDVLEAMYPPSDQRPCIFGLSVCSSVKPCPLHFKWKSMKNQFNVWAMTTTLKELENESANDSVFAKMRN